MIHRRRCLGMLIHIGFLRNKRSSFCDFCHKTRPFYRIGSPLLEEFCSKEALSYCTNNLRSNTSTNKLFIPDLTSSKVCDEYNLCINKMLRDCCSYESIAFPTSAGIICPALKECRKKCWNSAKHQCCSKRKIENIHVINLGSPN